MSSVSYQVRRQWKKVSNSKLASFFRRGHFNSSQCKTWARMTIARIKLLRNKRESAVRVMRRDVALLLKDGQSSTARIRVEHVIREQNAMAANEILELFCERIITRLSIISKQRHCPADLKEAISSLIFAGPRCSDIPELMSIKDIFQSKYGKDFVSAATDLRPDSGVNLLLIEKLSALNPPGELKLKVMKEIAKEYQVEWDTSETEVELLKPQEDRIEGPRAFVSASSLPLNHGSTAAEDPTSKIRLSGGHGDLGSKNYQDAASAAKAAADSAKDALAAALAAAQLAQTCDNFNGSRSHSKQSWSAENLEDTSGTNGGMYNRSQSLGTANNCSYNGEMHTDVKDDVDFNRRYSYSVRHTNADIRFDESDCDEENEMEPPSGMHKPQRSNVPSNVKPSAAAVHPKLPDYDALAARFEALKYHKS